MKLFMVLIPIIGRRGTFFDDQQGELCQKYFLQFVSKVKTWQWCVAGLFGKLFNAFILFQTDAPQRCNDRLGDSAPSSMSKVNHFLAWL